jgi:tetratricopeptide (TPR) repeat protein
MAATEYGLAAYRFHHAAELNSQEPLALFYLAQAYFGLGKFREAVDAIEAGLRLKPDWPRSPFRSRELYGPQAADLAEHLKRLEKALERYPEDVDLVFLQAYEMWFDGRQAEAVPLFQRAAKLAPGKVFIQRFLETPPAGPVVAR